MDANTVMVGVDGSEGSAMALRWAAEQARARGWDIEATLAWGFLEQHHIDPEEPFDPAYDDAHAQAALESYVQRALGADGAAVRLRTVLDLPARGLLEAAEGAALLVVGARGLGGFKGLVLGSVSQHCLHHATGPVAVVHETGTVELPPRVVVAVDGSPHSVAAIRWGAQHAAATGARLQLLHAWYPTSIGGEPFVSSPFRWDDVKKAAQLTVELAVTEAELVAGAPPPETVVVDGSAAKEIVAASSGASMVVVGARGLGGFAGLLLGSVSTQVVRHAHCPVVVIPDGER